MHRNKPYVNKTMSAKTEPAYYHDEPFDDIYGSFADKRYPIEGERLLYDFLFLRKGVWVYMSSSDRPDDLVEVLSPPCVKEKAPWRVCETATGRIVRRSRLAKKGARVPCRAAPTREKI